MRVVSQEQIQQAPQRRYNLRSSSIVGDDGTVKPTTQQSIDHEEDEEDEEDEQGYNNTMILDNDGKPLFDVDRNGLPMEMKPGDNKFRVPDFMLSNSE
jgi:hypothetical protein